MKPLFKSVLILSALFIFLVPNAFAFPIEAGDTVKMGITPGDYPYVPYLVSLLDENDKIVDTFKSFCLESQRTFVNGGEYTVTNVGGAAVGGCKRNSSRFSTCAIAA